MPAKPVRNGIFISYSHADKKWLERLKVHLKPLEREHNLVVWDDTKLRSGDEWRTGISEAIDSTKVAILLVSADFLASDFINSSELPPLLKAAGKEGLIILPVIVSHCAFSFSPLDPYQTVNDPKRPLNSLTREQVEEVFFKLFQQIHQIFLAPTPPRIVNKAAASKATGNKATGNKATADKTRKTINPAPEAAPAKPAPKKGDGPQSNATPKTEVVSSASQSALLVKPLGTWDILAVSGHSETGGVLSLTFQSPTPSQRSFLLSLRPPFDLDSIVYSKQTYSCKLKSLQSKNEGTRETWYLDAIVTKINSRLNFHRKSFFDSASNRTTPSMQAQIEARALLLDEANYGAGPAFNLIEPVFTSKGAYLEIKRSPFPAIYQRFGKQPDVFNEAAKLIATWFLQVGCIVEHILELELSLKDQVVIVKFEGKCWAEHQNPPAIIRVEGTCNLSQPGLIPALKLRSLIGY